MRRHVTVTTMMQTVYNLDLINQVRPGGWIYGL